LQSSCYSRRPIRLTALVEVTAQQAAGRNFCPTPRRFEQEAKIPPTRTRAARTVRAFRSRTTEDFITEHAKVLGHKYYYAKVDYVQTMRRSSSTCRRSRGFSCNDRNSHSDRLRGRSKWPNRDGGKLIWPPSLRKPPRSTTANLIYSEGCFLISIDSEFTIICPISCRFRQEGQEPSAVGVAPIAAVPAG